MYLSNFIFNKSIYLYILTTTRLYPISYLIRVFKYILTTINNKYWACGEKSNEKARVYISLGAAHGPFGHAPKRKCGVIHDTFFF